MNPRRYTALLLSLNKTLALSVARESLVMARWLPETKGRTLEEIEEEFAK